jgi:hypothetical protein
MKHAPKRSVQVARATVRANRIGQRGLSVPGASFVALLAVPFKRAGDASRLKGGGKPVPKPEATPVQCANVETGEGPD